jgi:hypothetical protein
MQNLDLKKYDIKKGLWEENQWEGEGKGEGDEGVKVKELHYVYVMKIA